MLLHFCVTSHLCLPAMKILNKGPSAENSNKIISRTGRKRETRRKRDGRREKEKECVRRHRKTKGHTKQGLSFIPLPTYHKAAANTPFLTITNLNKKTNCINIMGPWSGIWGISVFDLAVKPDQSIVCFIRGYWFWATEEREKKNYYSVWVCVRVCVCLPVNKTCCFPSHPNPQGKNVRHPQRGGSDKFSFGVISMIPI